MTEIPEHLLKRSRERRAALSGESADSGDSGAATPATTPAATPAAAAPAAAPARAAAEPPKPPPKKPDPPYISAAKSRPKIPWWAMSVLAVMPVLLLMYWRGLTPQEAHAEGPTADGAEIFASACASCHLADGSGSSGRQLNEGDVLLTFPRIEWQLNLVYTGSEEHNGQPYGDPNREAGAHIGVTQFGAAMPAQGSKFGGALTDAEILAVVCHERYDLSGNADPTSEEWLAEYERWCSPESEIYAGLQDGSLTFDDESLGVGTDPIDFTNPPPLPPEGDASADE